jgi:hypothetical protein
LHTPSFDPSRTAAALGAGLLSGRLDPCGLVEETLAAIADYPDEALFIEVTAARARKEAAASVRCSGPGDHGRIGRVEIRAPGQTRRGIAAGRSRRGSDYYWPR